MTEHTRHAVDGYLRASGKRSGQLMFSSRQDADRSMTTRQYARLVSEWIAGIGLDPHVFATHSLRRTKATLIYRRTGNLRAVQLLLNSSRFKSRRLSPRCCTFLLPSVLNGKLDTEPACFTSVARSMAAI